MNWVVPWQKLCDLIEPFYPRNDGAGVLMIPTPQAGILRRVEGVLAAGKVPYIEEVVIYMRAAHPSCAWW